MRREAFPSNHFGETVETFASGMIGGTDPPRNGRNIRAIRIKGGFVMFSVVSNLKTEESPALTTHCCALKQAPGPSPGEPSKDGPGPNSGDGFST